MNLTRRPRRLRTTAAMRALTAETALRPEQLIQVFFVRDGISEPQPISSMPGQYQHTLESLIPAVRQAAEAGIKCIDLFGVPLDDDKDEVGSAAWDDNGILNALSLPAVPSLATRLLLWPIPAWMNSPLTGTAACLSMMVTAP